MTPINIISINTPYKQCTRHKYCNLAGKQKTHSCIIFFFLIMDDEYATDNLPRPMHALSIEQDEWDVTHDRTRTSSSRMGYKSTSMINMKRGHKQQTGQGSSRVTKATIHGVKYVGQKTAEAGNVAVSGAKFVGKHSKDGLKKVGQGVGMGAQFIGNTTKQGTKAIGKHGIAIGKHTAKALVDTAIGTIKIGKAVQNAAEKTFVLSHKPAVLKKERIRALIDVFKKGNTKLGIQPNEHKAKELKWLLSLIYEEDTACWISGSAIRAQRSHTVKANCYICQTTLLFRHHCRRCGTLVCDACSQERCNLKVYWDDDDEHKPCLRVVSTSEDLAKRASQKLRTCDQCITQMLDQQKNGQGENEIKTKHVKSNISLVNDIDIDTEKLQYDKCIMCRSNLPLNDKWHHPIDVGHDPTQPNYWRTSKKDFKSNQKMCINCVTEKRHQTGYLQTYDVTLTNVNPNADAMDIQDAVELKFPFSVHNVQISRDANKNPRKDKKGNITCIISVIDVLTRNALMKLGQLEILTPCGLQEGALVRVWPRASTREQLQKLGEPTHGFFRKNIVGYSDMVFVRKNRESYTFLFGTREKTFKISHIVLSGRRPSAKFPSGSRLEDGYCSISHGFISSKQGIGLDHSSVLTIARNKVQNSSNVTKKAKLKRRFHRAHGKDFRCVGAPDCMPDTQKKQYCMTCGGVRFSRDDLLQQRVSTSDAVQEAIRQDDVVRLRACVLLKGSKGKVKKDGFALQINSNLFFLDLESVKGPLGSSPVHMCVEYRATECLDFMFRLQSSRYSNMFTWVDDNGATPLHIAARVGWSVRRMVRQGAAPTVTTADHFGMLPIHYAALRAGLNDLKELLNVGSKHYQLNKRDKDLKTAFDCVDRGGPEGLQCVSYLKLEMKKTNGTR